MDDIFRKLMINILKNKKLIADLHDKAEYVIHKKKLK